MVMVKAAETAAETAVVAKEAAMVVVAKEAESAEEMAVAMAAEEMAVVVKAVVMVAVEKVVVARAAESAEEMVVVEKVVAMAAEKVEVSPAAAAESFVLPLLLLLLLLSVLLLLLLLLVSLLLLLLLSLPSLPSLLLLLLLLSLLPKPLERLRYYARQMPLQRARGASVPSEVRAATAQLRVAVLSWMAVNLPRAREEPTISVADERLDAALLQGWSTDGGRRAAVRALGPTPNCKLRAA
jgi:hypothetical protein